MIIAVLGGLFWLIMLAPSPENRLQKQPTSSSTRPLAISGLSYTATEHGIPISRIHVDQLQVRPRRFGALHIRSVNELVLVNAQFDLYQAFPPASHTLAPTEQRKLSLQSGLNDSLKGVTKLQGMGYISRAWADKLTLRAYGDRRLALAILARNASFDFKKQQTTFLDATITGEDGHFQLATAKLIWDEKAGLFSVPDAYTIHRNDEYVVGTKAYLTPNLKLIIPPGALPPKTTNHPLSGSTPQTNADN